MSLMRILLVAFMTLAAGSLPASESPPKPALLLCTWSGRIGEVDFNYLQQLVAKGFVVDFLDSRAQFTWDKIKQYNALVLYDFPGEGKITKSPEGGPGAGPNLDETLALLDRYLQAGGGVLINVQHVHGPTEYEATRKGLARFGARLPVEKFHIPAADIAHHPRLRNPFLYTRNIAPSPVSEGVNAVWFMVGSYFSYVYNLPSGPIDVDDSWTVVVRAGPGSRTEPIDPGNIAEINRIQNPFQRPGGVAEPPLFAVRDLQPGRLALFRCWPVFHIGSGTYWFHNGAMLDKGLNGKPSDFGRLLENTYRWLAQPSLESKSLGGATLDLDHITPPQLRPGAKEKVHAWWRGDLALHRLPADVKLFRGIIGPRTVHSGGKGTVATYAAAAREKKLDFVIFLEDFRQLTPHSLKQLAADCKAESKDGVKLFAGYRIRTNVGNTMFFFGDNPLYPYEQVLIGDDRKTLMLQTVDTNGVFVAGAQSLQFVFDVTGDHKHSVGYFDFTGPQKQGGMGVADLRAFSMAGVMYYRDGRLVEDVTEQQLLTAQGTMIGTPVAVNLVDSPEAMAAEVDKGHALTYAAASSLDQLWEQALRWNHQYDGMNVFPSNGPLIQLWPACVRICTFGAEDFVAENCLVPCDLQVRADAGLKEVAIYDGTNLFRRFLPVGETNLNVRLFLSGVLQRNLTVVATDANGGKAVSFTRRHWKDGSPAAVFCGDHVNDCGGMKFARGPVWQKPYLAPWVPMPGATWDGGPPAVMELLPLGHVLPAVVSDAGEQNKFPLYQIPLLELCDERVHRGRSVADRQIPIYPHANPWQGFGPTEPTPLFDATACYTEFAQYPIGVDPFSWGCPGLGGGNTTGLFEQELTFKRDQTIQSLNLTAIWRTALPDVNVLLLVGEGDRLLHARDITPRKTAGQVEHVIPTGGWFSAVSGQEANSVLYANYGMPIRLKVNQDRMELNADIAAGGWSVKAGEQHRFALLSMIWPMDINVPDSDALLRIVRYLQRPDGMELLRGERIGDNIGLLDLRARDGAIELKLPKPQGLNCSIPARVHGLNPRWTALLWQHEGYNGKNYHGTGKNRTRPLGIDPEGRAYLPLYTGVAPLTHVTIGQPVVTDESGKDLFIQVTPLTEGDSKTPPQWHVSVNNPTDAAVTCAVRVTMPLPGLTVADQTLTLAPGEHRVLLHGAQETGK